MVLDSIDLLEDQLAHPVISVPIANLHQALSYWQRAVTGGGVRFEAHPYDRTSVLLSVSPMWAVKCGDGTWVPRSLSTEFLQYSGNH